MSRIHVLLVICCTASAGIPVDASESQTQGISAVRNSLGPEDHRVEIKIDRRVTIVPPGSGLKRAMLSMVRHPDGSILLNLQTQPLLLSSRDNGKNWTPVPIKLPDAPPKQRSNALGVSRDGRLWLMHQSSGVKDLFVSVSQEPFQKTPVAQLAWKTTRIDFARLAPDRKRPFALCSNDYNTFFQQSGGTMLWTKENVIVAPHSATGPRDYRLVASISLDGGKTWVDGTKHGAAAMSKARSFELVSNPPGFSFTTPTVQVSRNRFLTVYCSGTPMAVQGVFWHLRRLASREESR